MTTVRKNSKEFKEAVNNSGWFVRCLSSNFEAIKCNSLLNEFHIRHGKMRKDANGKITLSVHSNLWYEKYPENN
jgi:hypothetical protein